MAELAHPLKASLVDAREAIMASHRAITEHVKWNAPSFCWEGDDRVTMNLRGDTLTFVFHRGVKKKDATGFSFPDATGLMKWAAADRATVTIASPAEWKKHKKAIVTLVGKWMKATA
ncbi:MAG: DUF1801 domain-containing protein [Labilithrix sp.]|nr:DUF1801 domain-containing protein [Labilithrix sp.]